MEQISNIFASLLAGISVTHIVQGIIIGGVLAFITAQLLGRIKIKKINGWSTMYGFGVPGNGMLLRAASYQVFPGPVNVPQEAMYWTTTVAGGGNYIMHFPPGGFPPNNAFWSLTMSDANNDFVANPLNRYIVNDRSQLAQNPDGSTDIYLQNTAPTGHESNWLPAPRGKFILWLRVYMPGAAILDGSYQVPPVIKMK
ncbi:MAG TPA: DUF1214 domain-containing protein [Candidatus Paceibacterota bacterium]|nr:DUF1214 domain-containing protein [Candidatus Paceibacterota bacterium]